MVVNHFTIKLTYVKLYNIEVNKEKYEKSRQESELYISGLRRKNLKFLEKSLNIEFKVVAGLTLSLRILRGNWSFLK